MKILLFGCNGQVGWELQRSLAPLGEVVALGSSGGEGLCGDFTDLAGLSRTVSEVQPDVIVNAAAYTAVDKAESDRELARMVNAEAPGVLAQAASRSAAALVHFSTDYVFDGSGTRPWLEADPTGPLSVYGSTKLQGEQRVVQAGCRHLILRTSWVFAARGGNFAKTMLRLARERDRLTVIDDQFGAPTGAELLADVTVHALKGVISDPLKSGIYHVAAAGEASWHSYAQFVLEQAQQRGQILKAASSDVVPVPTSSFPTPARRPHNSRLDTRKFRSTFGLTLPPWQRGVERMLQEIL